VSAALATCGAIRTVARPTAANVASFLLSLPRCSMKELSTVMPESPVQCVFASCHAARLHYTIRTSPSAKVSLLKILVWVPKVADEIQSGAIEDGSEFDFTASSSEAGWLNSSFKP
jgi:hypothetical protein